VQYTSVGGEYVLHQDGNQRLLTVLYYLEGVGETWFPLARVCDHDSTSTKSRPTHRLQALQQTKTCVPGRDGLLLSADHKEDMIVSADHHTVRIQKGDTIAFYNYLEDGTMDWTAIHAGLPTTTTRQKWIANHWFHFVPFGNNRDNQR
jgi:hypothetical protein